ncbi:hypothetical protein Y032_0176g540 [Ancylostoma ceylanicum]|uniref:Uncharacterized protein n=1 Tax=Ancylostoma ceylanicum TaxID=53326 RepID=A0A016SU62_9BILA|nr:hypothetical protein Y032_0176g540 [Ancylostoma ceylanicum]
MDPSAIGRVERDLLAEESPQKYFYSRVEVCTTRAPPATEQNGEQVTVRNQVRSGSGIESCESIMEDILRGLSRIPQQLAVGLDEHRVANKYREPMEKAITSAISETMEKINTPLIPQIP